MKRLSLWLLACCLFLGSCGADRESYRLGRDPTWFPLDFIGRERAVTAFSDGLTEEIGERENFGVSLYNVSWVSLQEWLRTGRLEGILSSLPPTPHFRKFYDFSDVYLHVGPVLVVAEGVDVDSLEEMRGKRVGVLSGSPSMIVAARIPDVVIVDYGSIPVALAECAAGNVDGVLMERLPAYTYVKDLYAGVLKVATGPLTDEGLRLVVLKGEQGELLERFNRGLADLKRESEWEKLAKKWELGVPAAQ